MAFETVESLDCDKAYAIGGVDKKTGKPRPKSVEGYYLGSKEVANKLSRTGKGWLHLFQTETGKDGIFGKADMDKKLKAVNPGTMTRVTATDKTIPTPRGDMMIFTVEVDKSNTIDVTTLPSNDITSNFEETTDDNFEDAALVDEPAPARPARPAQAARPPSAATQASVKALLSAKR